MYHLCNLMQLEYYIRMDIGFIKWVHEQESKINPKIKIKWKGFTIIHATGLKKQGHKQSKGYN